MIELIKDKDNDAAKKTKQRTLYLILPCYNEQDLFVGDYGVCAEQTQNMLSLAKEGYLNSASLSANSLYTAEACAPKNCSIVLMRSWRHFIVILTAKKKRTPLRFLSRHPQNDYHRLTDAQHPEKFASGRNAFGISSKEFPSETLL